MKNSGLPRVSSQFAVLSKKTETAKSPFQDKLKKHNFKKPTVI